MAMTDLWEQKPLEIANAVQMRVRSTLLTRVKRIRRGAQITYTLAVPEINRNYNRIVSTDSEYAK